MMESPSPLLRRYRSDRRKLLEFLLSSTLVSGIKTPAGPTTSFSNINFDSLSADYLLECIQSGRVFDVSEATKRYYDESSHPIMCHLQSGDCFYLHSGPESAGSPPNHFPPSIPTNQRDFVQSHKSQGLKYTAGHESFRDIQETRIDRQLVEDQDVHNRSMLSVGLPNLKTGLRDDDLRESAYEVLLACMLFSGVEIYTIEGNRKREKSSKFLAGLKSRKDKRHIESEPPQPTEKHLKLLDIVRISEAADTFIRRRLTQFAMGRSCGQIDIPQLSLVLLTGLSKFDLPNEKSYHHWKDRQANLLEELVSSHHKKTEKQMIKAALAKIRNPEEWDVKMSPSDRNAVLLSIRQVALAFSSKPGQFMMEGETYYWTAAYHLNMRLYEKLLFGVFDILEDGQLIEEAEEILKLLKMTWSVLGITERLHHALFAWVLFQQFVATEEAVLLDYAVHEVEKVLSAGGHDDKEMAYMNSLTCSTSGNANRLNLLQSIFLSTSTWCDSKLLDYHLHFSQKPSFFEKVLTIGLSTGIKGFVPLGNIQFTGSCHPNDAAARKIRLYVEKTMDAACNRAIGLSTKGSGKDKIHPLAVLASELRLVAEKDLSVFSPILRRWNPDCTMVSAKILHQFYGERLTPFINDITCLTEGVRKVLPAAYALENWLIKLYSSSCEESHSHYGPELERYPIAEISKSVVLDWVVSQQERILEWVGRAFDLENWEPLSAQKKQAASAVEVFRIIEETVDQFFDWSIPMDITHLQALLSIIFHSLNTHKLYPSAPPLTRYKEATFPILKKKVAESSVIDNEIYSNLEELTASKLCVRLNTYQYIKKQVDVLEEGIRKSWKSIASYQMERQSRDNIPETPETKDVNGESVSELFVATLDIIRDSAADAIRRTRTRIVFWDMRDSFLSYLYHSSVDGNRLDSVLPEFDKVLNNVCRLIDDSIRDPVVSSIWKEAMEGFMWVLLDGGPSRAFSDTDVTLIEEDFNMLKDMFVAEGEGLPRSLVEKEAKSYNKILSLFSLPTESLIQMLMASSEHISVGVTSYKGGQRYKGDAHTLIRILCHKKDSEASKFLKRQYRLPSSSEYDECAEENSSSFSSPLVADLLKRSASFRWSEKGQSSFRSITKRFQEAKWR
ncbi:hypothetical protein STAS_20150 [Striga asiatica]|uniref:Protein unc-13 homolog n=1 Tax=Striga asiatica TaxID=4170 RepID=A0A5A7QE17_STRAF|nr:hypothetical protein STAS_20150 [Striga asiatica]